MIDVVLMPGQLPETFRLERTQVVVLDVLRASSTMVTALAHGAREVRLFGDIESALSARASLRPPVILGGERQCVPIPGFDLGNSPSEYVTHKVGGATVCLTTTNGTVATLAAESAHDIYIGSLLNAAATARALLPRIQELDTILLCAGTEGHISCEDVIGAGAILWQLLQQTHSLALPYTDMAWVAYQTFAAVRAHLPPALRLGLGGINLIEAGLEEDIDWCAKIDSKPITVKLERSPLRAVRQEPD